MKTKKFLLLCLFLGIGFMQLSAQNGKNGTGTLTWVEPIEGNTYDLVIYCNGEEADILNFPMYFELRIREHYKNGEYFWGKYLLNNAEYTSKLTGEIFKAHDLEKQFEKGFFTWRMNLKGNMGHHYIIRMVFETTYWEMIEYHSVCN